MQDIFNIGNESESGLLEGILMHRPGGELRRLRSDNLEELLFDEIPDINKTHQSHDIFTNYLREHGVQVLYVTTLLLMTLTHSAEACEVLIDGIIINSLFYLGETQQAFLSALREWLSMRKPDQLVKDVIEGVRFSQDELGSSSAARSLLSISNFNSEFIIPPLPNLVFTRDSFSIIEKNVFIWQMAKPARRNEPLIMRVIFQYHPELSTSGLKIFEWQTTNDDKEIATIEGGDVAYLGDNILLIGSGERTNRVSIEALARTGLFRQVIAVVLPPQRDYMHLDTVLSSVGRHAFTLHSRLANIMEVFTVETRDANNNVYSKPQWTSHGSDICHALRTLLNDGTLTFYDAADEETSIVEQRECRHNVLAINDCHVMTYDGGNARKGLVAEMTRNQKCTVGLVPTDGLLEGCGGMHCMTNAIRRRRC